MRICSDESAYLHRSPVVLVAVLVTPSGGEWSTLPLVVSLLIFIALLVVLVAVLVTPFDSMLHSRFKTLLLRSLIFGLRLAHRTSQPLLAVRLFRR